MMMNGLYYSMAIKNSFQVIVRIIFVSTLNYPSFISYTVLNDWNHNSIHSLYIKPDLKMAILEFEYHLY